jgi:hypothetical protein
VGVAIVLAVRILAPNTAVPLYDGVVVAEPYRYLTPPAGAAGNPTSYAATPATTNGQSPDIVAATKETPPQAQLIAAAGSFNVPAGTTSLKIAVDPVPPPSVPPPAGAVGNVYRVSVTDASGAAVPVKADSPVTVSLRAPAGSGGVTIWLFDGSTWTAVRTDAAGQPDTFLTATGTLGEFVLVGSGFGIDPITIVAIVGTAVVVVAVAIWYRRESRRRAAMPEPGNRAERRSARRNRGRGNGQGGR